MKTKNGLYVLHKKFFLNFQNGAFLGFYLTFEINLLNNLQ